MSDYNVAVERGSIALVLTKKRAEKLESVLSEIRGNDKSLNAIYLKLLASMDLYGEDNEQG